MKTNTSVHVVCAGHMRKFILQNPQENPLR